MNTFGTHKVPLKPDMTEEIRLRRKQLRRRPQMLLKAKEYGLLPDTDDHWTFVTQKGRKR